MMAGRKLDPIWIHFEKVKKVPGVPVSRAKCKKCSKELQGLTARLKAHYEKCQQTDEQEAYVVEDVLDLGSSTSKSGCCVTTQNPVATVGPPWKKKKSEASGSNKASSPSIVQYLVKTTPTQKEALDMQIASAMFATNTTFSCIEHPEVINTIEMLRPGYTPPNRKNISGKL